MLAIYTTICLALGMTNTIVYAAPTYFDLLARTTTCGGDPSLSPCGGLFPADFCCPHSSICLPLNATGAIATVCCPPGVDCSTIQPTTCEQGAYNATTAAANQIHAAPIVALATCGSACCPAGYSCQNGKTCTTINNSTAAATIPTQSLAPTSTPTTSATTTTTTTTSDSLSNISSDAPSSSSFSGSSFAAGFVPGMVLGMLLLIAILWLIRRRRRARGDDEKTRSQDRLTSLGPSPAPQRLAPHMRSISGPAILGESHRTDFLRGPAGNHTSDHSSSFETIDEERSSASDQYHDLRPMFQFEASPIPSRSPLPLHMKRGTLSYAISPIRQLRTKKSVSSLRRHATDASQRARLSIARSNTSVSTITTGTIQVHMTPDQRPSYVSPDAHDDRPVSPIASSTYPQEPWTTPTKQPSNPRPAVLGSPYSYHAREQIQGDHLDPYSHSMNKRVTTFSSLMEKAGLRREDFLPRER